MGRFFGVLFILISSLTFSQEGIKYAYGFSASVDFLRLKQYLDEFEYFSYDYSGGTAFNLSVTNKFSYKRLFSRVDFGYNYATQQQKFVFSNPNDLNIGHKVRHSVPHCSFDFSIGRAFQLENANELQVELGLSTKFSMVVGPYNLILEKSGSFSSAYSDPEEHYNQEMVTKEYNYEMDYERPTLLTPFARIGIQAPLGENYIVYGITATARRLVYENFIYLTSESYSAIANSRSQSSSFGIFVNYQFGY